MYIVLSSVKQGEEKMIVKKRNGNGKEKRYALPKRLDFPALIIDLFLEMRGEQNSSLRFVSHPSNFGGKNQTCLAWIDPFRVLLQARTIYSPILTSLILIMDIPPRMHLV
jgi:hypothetical protein